MYLYGNKPRIEDAAIIDHDVVAFNVSNEERDEIGEFLIAAIVTRCLMEFGQTPDILE